MHALLLASGGEGFVPPDAGAFDLPPFFDSLPWLNKPVLDAVLVLALVAGFFLITTRRMQMVPGKGQFLAESIYGFVRKDLGRDIMGSQDFMKFVPLIFALFTWIAVNNVFGIIPFIQFPTMSHIGFPISLALISWAVFNYVGIRRQGFVGYFKNMMFPPGVPGWVYGLLAPIELVSTVIVRPVTLALRLFANMFAGHLLLLVFMLGAEYMLIEGGAALKAISVLPFALSIVMTFFELLIQLLQAYVFALLTSLYIAGALSEAH